LLIGSFRAVRGRGLLNAVEIDPEFHTSAWCGFLSFSVVGRLSQASALAFIIAAIRRILCGRDICMKLKANGLLAKPTHNHIIRLVSLIS